MHRGNGERGRFQPTHSPAVNSGETSGRVSGNQTPGASPNEDWPNSQLGPPLSAQNSQPNSPRAANGECHWNPHTPGHWTPHSESGRSDSRKGSFTYPIHGGGYGGNTHKPRPLHTAEADKGGGGGSAEHVLATLGTATSLQQQFPARSSSFGEGISRDPSFTNTLPTTAAQQVGEPMTSVSEGAHARGIRAWDPGTGPSATHGSEGGIVIGRSEGAWYSNNDLNVPPISAGPSRLSLPSHHSTQPSRRSSTYSRTSSVVCGAHEPHEPHRSPQATEMGHSGHNHRPSNASVPSIQRIRNKDGSWVTKIVTT